MKFPYLSSIAVSGLNTLYVHSNTHGSVISLSSWHGKSFRNRLDGSIHLFDEPGHVVGTFPLADPVAALETILGPLDFAKPQLMEAA